MGLISKMETVVGRDFARLILLVFILLVVYTGFIALLIFLFVQLGLFDRIFYPIYAPSNAWPFFLIGVIFFVIPFWLIVWRFLVRYKFEKKVFSK
jgi:hypothetical protein